METFMHTHQIVVLATMSRSPETGSAKRVLIHIVCQTMKTIKLRECITKMPVKTDLNSAGLKQEQDAGATKILLLLHHFGLFPSCTYLFGDMTEMSNKSGAMLLTSM